MKYLTTTLTCLAIGFLFVGVLLLALSHAFLAFLLFLLAAGCFVASSYTSKAWKRQKAGAERALDPNVPTDQQVLLHTSFGHNAAAPTSTPGTSKYSTTSQPGGAQRIAIWNAVKDDLTNP